MDRLIASINQNFMPNQTIAIYVYPQFDQLIHSLTTAYPRIKSEQGKDNVG